MHSQCDKINVYRISSLSLFQMHKLEQLTLDPSLVKIKEKMIARQAHLHKECARLGMRRLNLDDPEDMSDVIAHNGNLDTIFWNDKFKFITSVIFKVRN